MTIAFTHHHFTDTRHGGDDLTRFEGQDLIGIAMEQK